MSLRDCMIKNGFSEAEIRNLSGGDELTDVQFKEAMIKAQEGVKDKVRKAKIQMLAVDSIMKKINSHGNGKAHGILALLGFDKSGTSGIISVDLMSNHYEKQAHATMSDMMEKLMPKTSSLWEVDDALRLNIVKEVFGEATGDVEAGAFAKSFIKANEDLRVLHNKLGGDIKKDSQWNLPQSHNSFRIRKAPKAQWVDELLAPGVLDLAGMENKYTGKSFMSPEEVRPFLDKMYDSIVTNGNSKMDWDTAVAQGNRTSVGIQNRQRFLRFKSGESYLNYQKKYGEDNIYSAMLSHIKGLANDTALIKQFGPNPQAAFNYAMGKARADPKAIDRLLGRAENAMQILTGESVGPNTKIQRVAETIRAVNTFKLGGASISAIGDQGTMAVTAGINGLPIMKNTMNFLKQMAGEGKVERQYLLQLGLNSDYVMDVASGLSRYGENDALSAWGKFSKVPDRFIRLTGLNKMTEAGRASIQISALTHLANVENLKWKDLSSGNLRMLKESGIDEADWGAMAKSKKQVINGAKLLDTRILSDDLQMKVSNMMDVLAFRAIPAPDVEAQAIMRQGTKSGTVAGEGFKSGGQFKSFSVSVLLTHIEYAKQFGAVGGAAYLAGTFVTLTAMGLVAVQIKQLVAGKEPMNLNDRATWVAAMMQGGGAGIFADFIFKDQSRFGSSMAATIAGPSASSLESIIKKLILAPTQKAFVAALDGDADAFKKMLQVYGVDFTNEVRNNLPTQLWYSKLLFDRYVFQTISQLSDPNYINKLHKREARLQKDEDRGFLFQPVEL